MLHRAADLLAVGLVSVGLLAWVVGKLPPRAHGRDVDWADAVAGAGGAAVGGWAAVRFGGAGALPWMWLGVLLWWGLRSWGRAPEAPETVVSPGPLRAVGSVLVLAAAASLWIDSAAAGFSWGLALSLGVLVLVAGLAYMAGARVAQSIFGILPALGLAGIAIAAIFAGPGAASGSVLQRSLAIFEAAGDWQAGAMGAVGALTAVVIHAGIGLGASSGAIASPTGAGGGLRRIVIVWILSFDVGMALLGEAEARFDDPAARAEDGRAHMRPLERAHARAFLPSPRGQSVVLPVDTPLESGKRYTVWFRANPRGYKVGVVSKDGSAIALPAFASTEGIEAVYFRDKDPQRGASASWDLRVPVKSEAVELPSGATVRKLTRADEDTDLNKLSERWDGPYLPLQDISVEVAVFEASAPAEQIGDHLAMVEILPEGPRTEFDLQTIVSMGFRGPLLEATPPGPLAFEAAPGLPGLASLELGTRRRAELRAPAGGLRFGELRPNGELALPAWRALAEVEHLAFHPREGTTGATFYVPVELRRDEAGEVERVDGRIRLRSQVDAPITLLAASKLADYEGPFLPVAAQPLWLELHSGMQLADPASTPLADRGRFAHEGSEARVWVPLSAADAGPEAEGWMQPDAGAWIEAGMLGPFASQSASGLAPLGPVALGLAALVWALAFVASWPVQPVLRGVALVLALGLGALLPAVWLLIAGCLCALLGNLGGRIGREAA